MRVITLAGSPRFPSRSSSLLEYAREKLNGLDVEVYHWNLQNFVPEDLLYARFDSPALKTFTEQLQQADGLIVATPVYKAAYSGALKTLLDLLPERALSIQQAVKGRAQRIREEQAEKRQQSRTEKKQDMEL